ncbi:MAG: hypothetical protein AMXMBFR84_05770 [Candidatus Hydrogenedentota bacterium]
MQNTGYINGDGDWQKSIVVIFLRGGADGLHLVAPVEDAAYYRARPLIGVSGKESYYLNDVFALHPRLSPLGRLYEEGMLAIVHKAGSEDSTRSHFEAQDMMEHGGDAGGWLGRYLRHRPGREAGALAAVAIGKTMPESLRGAPGAVAMESLEEFGLGSDADPFMRAIADAYARETNGLGLVARQTLTALHRLETFQRKGYMPSDGAVYPDDRFGRGMMQIARLIKARVGMEAACIDLDGWDSHFAQGSLIDPNMTSLAEGLVAFRRDLGALMKHTTVVVMTEFGRRTYENASLGTDHGRGSVMLVMGADVKGGRVYGEWKGLDNEVLEGPGDLPVYHNYRDVIAPVMTWHSGVTDLNPVFPSYRIAPMELYG